MAREKQVEVRSLVRRLMRIMGMRSDPRRRAASPAAPDLLAFEVDGQQAVVRVRLAKARHGLRELQLQTRNGRLAASFPFSLANSEHVATAAIDLGELIGTLGLRETADLYLTWERMSETGVTTIVRRRLGGFAETLRPPRAQRVAIGGLMVGLEVTVKGNVSLRVDDATGTGPRFTATAYRRDGRQIELVGIVKTYNRAVLGAATVVRGRASRTRVEFDAAFHVLHERTRQDHGLLHFEVRALLDLERLASELPESDELLDVSLELTLEDRREPLVLPYRFAEHTPEQDLTAAVTERDGMTHVFMPYLTYRTQKLAYRMERFTTADYRYLQRLLRVAWVFPLVKPFTGIWLVGELPKRAQDNGFHFFRWLRTHRPRRRAYYVIDPGSSDRDKVLPLGNVIDRGSRQHLLYSLLASRIVSSHHAEYLFASRHPAVVRRTRGVRVFLQHGITATKNVTPIYARQRTLELPTERFLVASELERRIIIEDYGYRPSQVPITGFARFDALFAAQDPPERTILVMPTWREGLRAETFAESDFYRHWNGFLTHPRFQRLLHDHGVAITLVVHPNLRPLAEFFDIPNVREVQQDETDIQSLLLQGSVLVTDFSSVAWDFSFLQRPVLYFQFDQEIMTGIRSPHIDYTEQLPGPVVSTAEQLIDEVAAVIERGMSVEPRYQGRAQAFATYRDQHNCERIYGVVARAWRPSTVFNRFRNARWVQRRWWKFRTGATYFTWMRRLFSLAAAMPRSAEIIFECDRGRHYGDAPRYLYERLIQRKTRPHIIWANNTTLRLTDSRTRKIIRHSPTYYWHLGRARYWVNNQNFPPDLAKPKRTTFLQTWHGTPLKRMQHDVTNMRSRDDGYQERAARLTSYWDVLLSGSAYATSCFRSAFRFQGRILEEGYPRNDVFSWPDSAARAKSTRQRLGLSSDPRKIILYAPTFRDDNRPDANWRHDLAMDVPRLAAELGNDYVLVLRLHPLVRQSISSLISANPEFLIDGSHYDDIQELLLISDVLVTDYSSVFFDYAVLQRPILFFAYDLDHYRDDLRGFYLDLEACAPGPMLKDNDELIGALGDLDAVRERYADKLTEFRRVYAPRDDGGASDRVLDAFFGEAVSASAHCTDAEQKPPAGTVAPKDSNINDVGRTWLC